MLQETPLERRELTGGVRMHRYLITLFSLLRAGLVAACGAPSDGLVAGESRRGAGYESF